MTSDPTQATGGAARIETQAEDRPSAFKRFGKVMTAIFTPILPPLIGAGILQGVLWILTGFNLVSADSSEYYILNTIGSAIFYFLPFLLAVSTARAFETNPYLSMGLAALLLHPNVTVIMSSPEPATFLSIPIAQTQYTSSVIPIILIVWVMSFVDRWLERVIPELWQTILIPTVLMLVMGVLGLLLLGPVGNVLANLLQAMVDFLAGIAGWLVPTAIGAFGALLISVGASFTLFPVALNEVATVGYNTVYNPGMLAVLMSLTGMSVAATQMSKQKTYKAYATSAALTSFMGVAQPALYGVAIPLGRTLLATSIGGFAGGLVAGLTGFRMYGFLPSGVAAIPAMVGPDDPGNLWKGIAVMVVAFVVGYVATRLIGFEEPSSETVAEIVGTESAEGDESSPEEAKSVPDATAEDRQPAGGSTRDVQASSGD